MLKVNKHLERFNYEQEQLALLTLEEAKEVRAAMVNHATAALNGTLSRASLPAIFDNYIHQLKAKS